MSFLNSIAFDIVKNFTEKQKTLSTAESCTGGLVASSITDIPGASKVFLGGVVVYATEMKKQILKIPDEVFHYGVISGEMAEAMAKAIKSITGSDYSIATTGNLGPDTMEGKPKGLIYVAVVTPSHVYVKELNLQGDRLSNKKEVALEALKLIIKLVEKKK
ncbi:CinA family protein [Thermodesulfovibrio sp. 3462-1]|uniref:CinA family protein n=1 Tax=Thermodesulfovibrio obliviosus TaxID=3118332 RepID=A0AAU8H2D2_9BACT